MNNQLPDNHVHLWYTHINDLIIDNTLIINELSIDEMNRARRYKFIKDHDAYLTRHIFLRRVLSKYCHCDPGELKFATNPYKKPFIDLAGLEDLKFNMSHSGNLILVGIVNHFEIGVDIEALKPIDMLEEIAIDNFSPEELFFFQTSNNKTETFYSIWTRKEAFIKGLGRGMYLPLKSFNVYTASGGNPDQPEMTGQTEESGKWEISVPNIEIGYAAALAVRTDHIVISTFRYHDHRKDLL